MKKDLKKMSLKNFFSISRYLDIKTNVKELINKFEYLPLEFLDIETSKENELIFIKVNFSLEIYKEVFNEEIRDLIIIDNIKNILI